MFVFHWTSAWHQHLSLSQHFPLFNQYTDSLRCWLCCHIINSHCEWGVPIKMIKTWGKKKTDAENTTGTNLRMMAFLMTSPSSRSASLAMKRSRFPVPSTPTKSRCSPDATQQHTLTLCIHYAALCFFPHTVPALLGEQYIITCAHCQAFSTSVHKAHATVKFHINRDNNNKKKLLCKTSGRCVLVFFK